MSLVIPLLEQTVALGSPLILAAMGGYFSERSGVINIALEGNMLGAAIAASLAGSATHSAAAGLGAGIAAGIVFALLHWLLTQAYRIDHIVSGMAINAVAFGTANFLDHRFGNPDEGASPGLSVWVFYAIALALPFAAAWYSARTRGGLWLKAVGCDPDKARQVGLQPVKTRFLTLVATGALCGLAGALLIANAHYYSDDMTAGRGFIALAALILGGWRPLPTLLACLAFGAFQALQIQLQGTPIFGVQAPREVWYSLPYLITVIALAGFLGKSRAPTGLGKY